MAQTLMKLKKKITDHDHSNKYVNAHEFNTLTVQNAATRLARWNIASKNDIAALVKKTDFNNKLKNLNKKITSNKTKHVLVKNEFKKWQTFS